MVTFFAGRAYASPAVVIATIFRPYQLVGFRVVQILERSLSVVDMGFLFS